MALYAIGDLHLCLGAEKPMDIFGGAWTGYMDKLKEGMSGRKAFTLFKRLLTKRGINLDDYVIDNGSEVKEEIQKPLIGAKRKVFYDRTFENVNHIDFHSSFAGGLANTHPEFRKTLEWLYENREKDDIYKIQNKNTIF